MKIRIDHLPGKKGAYKYEVYAIGERISGVLSSLKTREEAEDWIEKYVIPEAERMGDPVELETSCARAVSAVYHA